MIDKKLFVKTLESYEDAQFQNKVAFFWLGFPFLLIGTGSLIIAYKIADLLL